MHVDYTKICRVCMSNGSRDIFTKSIENGSPLDRLVEKLRYVAMIKIEVNDDLPRLLCDLCIVQLNVAYNFKRQAIENDTKLRQYFIENGISSPQLPSSNINETSANKRILDENLTSNIQNSVTTSTSNIPAIKPQEKNNFPIIPIIIKEEPNDDIVFISENSAVPSATTSIVPTSSSSFPDKTSMVYLNNYNLNNLTPTSDVEMLHLNDRNNCITTTAISNNINNEKPDSSVDTFIQIDANRFYNKDRNINTQLSDKRKQLAKKILGNKLKTRKIVPQNDGKRPFKREIKKLSINMVSPMGKKSRTEMKKNVNYSNLYKVNRLKADKTSNKKVVLNPYNECDKIKKRGRPSKCCAAVQNELTKWLKPKIEPDTKN